MHSVPIESFSQGQVWGLHDEKPKSQIHWEHLLKEACNSVQDYVPSIPASNNGSVAATKGNVTDERPRVYDGISKTWILVDTGAAVSVWPKAWCENVTVDKNRSLLAINGTKIKTYGSRTEGVRFARKGYQMNMIIADISQPVLGWDFLKKFQLDISWTQWGDPILKDKKANIQVPLKENSDDMEQGLRGFKLIENEHGYEVSTLCAVCEEITGIPVTSNQPIQTPVTNNPPFKTFQEWSQRQTIEANKKQKDPILKPQYKQILDKYPDLLKTDFHVSEAKHGVVHHIDTGDSTPCQAKPRRLLPGSPKEVEGKKNWLELDKLGIIQRVNPQDCNEWPSPLHLVMKPDGSWRVCGDFRPLNNKTQMDMFPLPNLKDFVGEIKGCTIFSKVDLVKAYHNIPLSPESQKKATIVTPWGMWQFRKLAMGMRNSAQSFQRLMTHVLAGMDSIYCYMDDILIFSKDETSHLKTIEELFRRLNEAGLAISPKKCLFGEKELDFVGYRVTNKGITPLPRKLEAIAKFPSPEKQKHLLGFLGAVAYYRRSLPIVNKVTPAEILQPLYNAATHKLKPGDKFTDWWRENNMEEHFVKAKLLLMNATQLVHPDHSAPLSITTDASDRAIGASLQQFVGGTWQPLGFWSRHLRPDKQKWTPYRRELLAIKDGIRHFIPEIQGRHLTVFTDHKAILGSFKMPDSQPYDPVAANHIQEISNWTTDIRYVKGMNNVVADLLSRPPGPAGDHNLDISQEDAVAAVQVAALEMVNHRALAKDQQTCPDVRDHRAGKCPKSVVMQEVEFSPGVRLLCEMTETRARPLVPKPWRDLVIRMFHQLTHPGQKETLKGVAARYYWPTMRKDVSQYVTLCTPCNAVKPYRMIRPPTAQTKVPDKRFSSLQVDVVGPMPESEGYRYLLTILDCTTRWLEAVPMKEATAYNCCQGFIRGWVQRFGIPGIILSDNGNTFVAQLWKATQKELGIDFDYTPPYHSSSLGAIERKHRDVKLGLKTSLQQFGDESGASWMSRLPWVLLARRTAFQPELDTSAAELVLGVDPKLPGDMVAEPGPPMTNVQVQQLLEGMRSKAARAAIQPSSHRNPPVYMPKGIENVTHVRVQRAKPGTLGYAYEGPFKIIERLGDSCLKLRVGTSADGTPRYETQHWNRCKPAAIDDSTPLGQKKNPGRKPLNPEAVPFTPEIQPTQPEETEKPVPVEEKAKPKTGKHRNTRTAVHKEDNTEVKERRTRTRVIKSPVRYTDTDYAAAVKRARA